MSRIHHDLAISYMPDDEPKALLCTAAMYVEVGRLEEGCVIYREMYKTVDEMEAQYRPYVLNNYGKDADVVYYKYRCTGLLGLLAVFFLHEDYFMLSQWLAMLLKVWILCTGSWQI